MLDFEDCIIRNIVVATSMEDALPVTLLHTDTEVGLKEVCFNQELL